jgi:hypothetical protein
LLPDPFPDPFSGASSIRESWPPGNAVRMPPGGKQCLILASSGLEKSTLRASFNVLKDNGIQP